MKYELSLLEEMIYIQLWGNLNGNTVTEPQAWSKEIEREIIRVEKAIISFVFVNRKEIERKKYIQHHQMRLLYIIRRIEHNNPSAALQTSRAIEPYSSIAEKHIQKLLSAIAIHFEEDILLNIEAPSIHQREVIDILKSKKTLMDKALHSLAIDNNLSEIIRETLDSFIHHSTTQSFTYGQLFMIRDMAALIYKYSEHPVKKEEGLTKWMVHNLCMLNFNHLNFYKFCRGWIVQYYPNGDDHYYRFTRFVKFFERIPVKPGYGWNIHSMSITNMLGDYFKDAALAVQRKQQWQWFSYSNNRDFALNEARLLTALTVDQLGLFMRLLKDTGILKASSVVSLIRFCMQHISTVGKNPAQEISYEYLKSSISKTTPDTIDRVEQHLQNMITLLRKFRLESRRNTVSKDKK